MCPSLLSPLFLRLKTKSEQVQEKQTDVFSLQSSTLKLRCTPVSASYPSLSLPPFSETVENRLGLPATKTDMNTRLALSLS